MSRKVTKGWGDGLTLVVTESDKNWRLLVVSLPKAPKGLATRGRRLWADVMAVAEPSPAELVTLEALCFCADRCAQLRQVLEEEGLMAVSRLGEKRVHPVVAELRAQETLLAKLAAQLAIPVAEGEKPAPDRRLRVVMNRAST